jgi:hypothetical protein
MNRYQVRFLDDGFLRDDPDFKNPRTKGDSVKDVIKFLWKKEKDHVVKLVENSGKLSIWQGNDKTLLRSRGRDGTEWYDLDKGKTISIKYLQKLRQDLKNKEDNDYKRITVENLHAKQFYKLIMLLWKELYDDFGASYIEFYEKKEGEWVDMFLG